jgi:hypothetical protein
MPTVEELVDKYQALEDDELLEIYSKKDEYSEEAQQAFNIVIKRKGGLEQFKNRIESQISFNKESLQLSQDIDKLIKQGFEDIEIREKLKFKFHTAKQVDDLISSIRTGLEKEKSDRKIKPRTILGSLIGGAIGGTIGGIIWGVQMVYSGHIFFIIGIGIALLNYILIKSFTKQSRKNIIVLIFTILATLFALLLGQLIYELIGYKGD